MDTDVKKKEPRFYNSLHVTPLVEIFDIKVNGNLNDGFKVYGSIEVTDGDHTFFIYNRTEDSPQFMDTHSGDNLLLTVGDNLDNAVIIPSEYVRLNVNLFAISGHDKITLRDSISLVRTIGKENYDWSVEYKTKTVKDKNNNSCTVKVQYAIFPYAVAATVRVMHFSKDDKFDSCVVTQPDYIYSEGEEIVVDDVPYYESADEEDVAVYKKHSCSDSTKLYGYVSAFAAVCGNNGRVSTLFSKQPEECVQVQSGRHIKLSRLVVAVPAYSSLKIEVSLYDGSNESLIADGMVEFKPVDIWQTYKKDIVRDNGRIRVQVDWSDTYGQLYRNNHRVMSEQQQVVSKRPSSTALNDDCSLPEHNSSETYTSNWVLPSSTDTEPLLEVFSVVVCSKDSKPFKFYGSIYCGWPEIDLWDESCPLECPTSGMRVLLLKGPLHHELEFLSLIEDLGLIVDIKDASSKAAISRGLIAFHIFDLDLLANRRICSVIRGKLGFAVVHYSIFTEGVSAAVNIKLSDKCPPVIIRGKIYARYDNCEPGRCYKDEFYKNLLFCDEGYGVQLNDSKHTLPLLKPYLSLPIESILIIEAVDLQFSTVDGSLAGGKVSKEIQFFNNVKSPKQIDIDGFCLDVSVSFSSRM